MKHVSSWLQPKLARIPLRKHALISLSTPYLMLLPLFAACTFVLFIPIIRVLLMSVQNWYLVAIDKTHYFLGLRNYVKVFESPVFRKSLWVTFVYLASNVVIKSLLGMGVALLLNAKFRGRVIARTIVIIPWATPVINACLIWFHMYDYSYGIVNALLKNLHLIAAPHAWLSERELVMGAILMVNIWKGYPFVAIMLLAGLQAIPEELMEAAIVDGANAWQRFRHVTLPLLRPVATITVLLLVIWGLKDFAIIWPLTEGGPVYATEFITIFVYDTAFKFFKFGQAAAAGVFMLAVSLVFTIIYLKALRGEEATW